MPLPPRYRYKLEVDISPEDIGTLLDALEDEPFSLFERLGEEELYRQIRAGRISFEAEYAERFLGFEQDVSILSVYLSQYIIGRELVISPTGGAPLLEGWKIIGRRGETARLLLELEWDWRAQAVVDRDEDVADAARRFAALPGWLKDSLRLKHPRLRAL